MFKKILNKLDKLVDGLKIRFVDVDNCITDVDLSKKDQYYVKQLWEKDIVISKIDLSEAVGFKDDEKVDLCIDFDGVLNSYCSGFLGYDILPDPPNPGAIEYLENLYKNGIRVAIMSSRAMVEDGHDGAKAIREWLLKNGLKQEIVDSIKITREKIHADLYVDDRGFEFKGEFPSIEFIRRFKPWYKRKD